jgi:ribosomal-protein-alanine N-acetyltransferase
MSIVIETKSLFLRSFSITDAGDLFDYLSLPEIYRFEPGEPVSFTQAEQIAYQRSQSHDFWAAELKSESRMVGHLSFYRKDLPEWMTWELGFIFNPKYQRRGFATEASEALVAYAFRELSAHRIVAHCNPENIASWKVLEKVGFTREGCLRKELFFWKDEQDKPIWTDTWVYAILESDLV